jgi:hypothetical protein
MTNKKASAVGDGTRSLDEVTTGKPSSTNNRLTFQVEHTITTDNYGGAPWVPDSEGWQFVRSLDGWRTLWRRITVADIA